MKKHIIYFVCFLGTPAKDGSASSYGRTPAYTGNQTPLYRDTGNKTPMCDSGSRTPLHYGSMTPIHDGSRTPNASSEWDPTVSNTYPSPAYNPSKSDIPLQKLLL